MKLKVGIILLLGLLSLSAIAADLKHQDAASSVVHQFADGVASAAVSNPQFALELLYMGRFVEEYSQRNDNVVGQHSHLRNEFDNHFFRRNDDRARVNERIDAQLSKDLTGENAVDKFLNSIFGAPLAAAEKVHPAATIASEIVGGILIEKMNESSRMDAHSAYDNWILGRADSPEKYYSLYYDIASKLRDASLESNFVDGVVTARIVRGTGGLTPRLTLEQIVALRTNSLGQLGEKQKRAVEKYQALILKPDSARYLTQDERTNIKNIAEQAAAEYVAENSKKSPEDVRNRDIEEFAVRKVEHLRANHDAQVIGIISDLASIADPEFGRLTRISVSRGLEISRNIELARAAIAASDAATSDSAIEAAQSLIDEAITGAVLGGVGLTTDLAALVLGKRSQETLLMKEVLKELSALRHQLSAESSLIRGRIQTMDSRLIRMHQALSSRLDAIVENQIITHDVLVDLDVTARGLQNYAREQFRRSTERQNASDREHLRTEYDTWLVRCTLEHWRSLEPETLKWCFDIALREAISGSTSPWVRGAESPSVDEMARWSRAARPERWSWANAKAAAVFYKKEIGRESEIPDLKDSLAQGRIANPDVWIDFVDAYSRLAMRHKRQYSKLSDERLEHIDLLEGTGRAINTSIKSLVLNENGQSDLSHFREAFSDYWSNYSGAIRAGLQAEAESIETKGKGWNIFAGSWADITRSQDSDNTSVAPISITYCDDEVGNSSDRATINKAYLKEHRQLYTFPLSAGKALMDRFPAYLRAGADLNLFRLEVCLGEPNPGWQILENQATVTPHHFVDGRATLFYYKPRVTLKLYVHTPHEGRRLESTISVEADSPINLKNYGFEQEFNWTNEIPHDFRLFADTSHKAFVRGKEIWSERLRSNREGSDLLNEFVRDKWTELDAAITRKVEKLKSNNIEIMSGEHVCLSRSQNSGSRVHICSEGPASREEHFRKPLERAIRDLRPLTRSDGYQAYLKHGQASGNTSLARIEGSRNGLLALLEVAFPRSAKSRAVSNYLDSSKGIPSFDSLDSYWKNASEGELRSKFMLKPLDPLACVVASELPETVKSRRQLEIQLLNERIMGKPFKIGVLVDSILKGQSQLGLLNDTPAVPQGELEKKLDGLISSSGPLSQQLKESQIATYLDTTSLESAGRNRDFVEAAMAWRVLQAIVCVSNLLERKAPIESHPLVEAGMKKLFILRALLSQEGNKAASESVGRGDSAASPISENSVPTHGKRERAREGLLRVLEATQR